MADILLVEDDEMIRRMLILRLSYQGYTVDEAVNGKEGVDKALENDYKLVLMDMHMPVMDGHTATKLLREKGYEKLIVAVTASVMSIDSEKAIASGCDDCISKPIDSDFEDRIKKLINE